MWDDEVLPARRRADEPWEDAKDRRYHDWSDLEGKELQPEPRQSAQNGPRPALRIVPDPEPEPEPVDAPAPDLVGGIRAWAARRLADIEAELEYQRLIGNRGNDGPD